VAKRQSTLENVGLNPAFWAGRRVLVTGHTGFKGAWLCLWLQQLGAKVCGMALPPATSPSLFGLLAPWPDLSAQTVDMRSAEAVAQSLDQARPEVIFHLAAQALVRHGYRNPVETFATNVLGTAHLLDCARGLPGLRALLVITSDKVYAESESSSAHREHDRLGGNDPYSASKACAEITTQAMRLSYFQNGEARVATARSGNVIGGGDWAADRLIPDAIRAWAAGSTLRIRAPQAIRPWQHVLEALHGYLMFAERMCSRPGTLPPALNFGPDAADAQSVSSVIGQLSAALDGKLCWETDSGDHPRENPALLLDSSAAAASLGWQPRMRLADAIGRTAEWYRAWHDGREMRAVSLDQLRQYQESSA
jgi:CDP-glucose 4,6-dehydratase